MNIKTSRIDIVVELKKNPLRDLANIKRGLVEAELQARQQAANALAEDERLKVAVGCIAAVGNVLEIWEVDSSETGGRNSQC